MAGERVDIGERNELPLALEQHERASSTVLCVAGSTFTGASLMLFSVTPIVPVTVYGPPEPVLPRSLVVTVIVSAP